MMNKCPYLKNATAGLMILTMAIIDLSVGTVSVKYENHEMKTYLADGEFGGEGSNFENYNENNDSVDEIINESIYHFNILEVVRDRSLASIGYSLDGFEPILDDIPGYDNEQMKEMRHACMDALVNGICGGDQNESKPEIPNYMSDFLTQFSDGEKKTFSTPFDAYTGYYKKVEDGKGYYSLIKGSYNSTRHTAKMVSKFYTNWVDSDRKNNYIWVDTPLSLDDLLRSSAVKSGDIVVTNHRKNRYVNENMFFTKFYTPQSYDPGAETKYTDISYDDWIKNHKVQIRTKTSGELSRDDIKWADVIYFSNGDGVYSQRAYDIYRKANPGRNLPDYGTFFNRVPQIDFSSFQMTIDIYERVAVKEDVAIVIDAKQAFAGGQINTNFRKLIAMLYLVNKEGVNDGKGGSGRLMFMDFMKRYSTNPGEYTDAYGNNYYDLMQENPNYIAPGLRDKNEKYMHFYQYNPGHPIVRDISEAITGGHYENGILVAEHDYDKARPRTIRRSTMEYYRDRGDRPQSQDPKGYYEWKEPDRDGDGSLYGYGDHDYNTAKRLAELHPWCMDGYESMSNTTDYIYIDDEGRLVRKNTYSSDKGYWYCIDEDDGTEYNWHCYKKITWGENSWDNWPWGTGCLDTWFFSKAATNGTGNLHLYYDYYQYGGYRAINDPVQGNFENQSFSQENGVYKADLLKDAIKQRKNKREYTDANPDHADITTTTVPHYYFLSVNILNGDGVNVVEVNDGVTKKKKGGNKVLYVNDYEIDEGLTDIPISFVVRTSENITKIELLKKSGSTESSYLSYTPKSGNDITNRDPLVFTGHSGITLNDETDYAADGSNKPLPDGDHHNLYIYKYKGMIENDLKVTDLTKSNNKFILRVYVKPVPTSPATSVPDEINIVKRNFFELD